VCFGVLQLQPVLRIHEIWYGSGSADPYLVD
jgi:hypothetical protein